MPEGTGQSHVAADVRPEIAIPWWRSELLGAALDGTGWKANFGAFGFASVVYEDIGFTK
jgi:hypothetical protein